MCIRDSVNAAVLIEGVTYQEKDGTNDLYADITLRQYARPETPVLPAKASAAQTLSLIHISDAAVPGRSYLG